MLRPTLSQEIPGTHFPLLLEIEVSLSSTYSMVYILKYRLFIILFNDDHVLQLRPETVIVRKRMRNGLDDYVGQMVSGTNVA